VNPAGLTGILTMTRTESGLTQDSHSGLLRTTQDWLRTHIQDSYSGLDQDWLRTHTQDSLRTHSELILRTGSGLVLRPVYNEFGCHISPSKNINLN